MPARKEILRKTIENDKLIHHHGGGKTASNSSSVTTGPVEQPLIQHVKDFFALEDDEAERSNAQADFKLFQQISTRVKENLTKFHNKLNEKSSSANGSSVGDKRSTISQESKTRIAEQVAFDLMMMRRLHRLAHFRDKKRHDTVAEERQKVDELYLQLQNLLYEVSHIEQEVTRCTEFKSAHEDINLIPVEQFYKEAEPSISKPAITQKDLHQQHLARLTWELETRKMLTEQIEKMQTEKEEVEKDIEVKQTQLDTLQPKLETLLEASKPVQEMLDMNYEKEAMQCKMAKFLPKPLFYAYVQAVAYKEVFDKKFCVSAEGDLEKVKRQEEDKANEEKQDLSDDESDSGTTTSEPKHVDSKKAHTRRLTVSDMVDEHVSDILSPHPLRLEFKIDCRNKATILVQLFYIPYLDVVSVKSRLELKADVPRALASAGDLLFDETMLLNLFEEDTGLKCPNPIGVAKLEHFKIDLPSTVESMGRLYFWAQRISGLNFIRYDNNEDSADADAEKSADTSTKSANDQSRDDKIEGCNYLQTVLRAVKKRVLSRLALQEQISSLETLNVRTPKEVAQWFSEKEFSSMTSWKSLTYEDFMKNGLIKKFTNTDIITEDGWFFTTTIERGEAKLLALIYVHCDYPSRPPVFCLSVNWDKETLIAETCSFLQILEQWINVDCVKRVPNQLSIFLLSIQMRFLLSRFDVTLEIESVDRGATISYAKEHLFRRNRRGRDRELPFVFSQNENYFHF